MAREKQARLFARIIGEVDPFTIQQVLNPKIGVKALDAAHQYMAAHAASGKVAVSGHLLWRSTETFTSFGTTVQGLFTGQTTVDDVLRAADTAWSKPRWRDGTCVPSDCTR
jgi:hypothetical protein